MNDEGRNYAALLRERILSGRKERRISQVKQ